MAARRQHDRPMYCTYCGRRFPGTETIVECWRCKGKTLTPSMSLLCWQAALGTHGNNRRFLKSLRIDPA